jgi:acyl carrier protein
MAQPVDANDSLLLDEAETPDWTAACLRGPLARVMQLLPADARACAACVCPAWRKAAADPIVRASLHFTGARVVASGALLGVLCARAGGALRELDLGECVKLSADDVIMALRAGGCTGLRRLVLQPCAQFMNIKMAMSLKQAQQLAAMLPALNHAACFIRCGCALEADLARTMLPGPLTLAVQDKLVMTYGCEVVPAALPQEMRTRIDAIVRAVIRRVIDQDNELSGDEPLMEIGIDSMGAVELVNMLQSRLGLELPSTLLFDYPTLNALGLFLAQEVVAVADEGAAAA